MRIVLFITLPLFIGGVPRSGEGVNKGVKVKVNSNEEVAEGNTAKREGV